MSDDVTHNLPDSRSFEERVFARFDAIDSRFDAIDSRFDAIESRFDAIDSRFGKVESRLGKVESRLDALEAYLRDMDQRLQKLEQKAFDTKPIWERALAEILAMAQKLDTIERKLNVLSKDMLTLRADQERLEDRMDKLDSKPV